MSDKSQAPFSFSMRSKPPETIPELKEWLGSVLRSQHWSRPELARDMGIEVRTLDRLLNGNVKTIRSETMRHYLGYWRRREEGVQQGPAAGTGGHFRAVPDSAPTPLNPLQLVHREGMADMEVWLWKFTLASSRAMLDMAEAMGFAPPRGGPIDMVARANLSTARYFSADTALPARGDVETFTQRQLDDGVEALRRQMAAMEKSPTPKDDKEPVGDVPVQKRRHRSKS